MRRELKPRYIVDDWRQDYVRSVAEDIRVRAGYGPHDYTIYLVDQSRGKCWHRKKWFSIPLFATRCSEAYLRWYIAHELSHVYQRADHRYYDCYRRPHGTLFYYHFKRICPLEYQCFETRYIRTWKTLAYGPVRGSE